MVYEIEPRGIDTAIELPRPTSMPIFDLLPNDTAYTAEHDQPPTRLGPRSSSKLTSSSDSSSSDESSSSNKVSSEESSEEELQQYRSVGRTTTPIASLGLRHKQPSLPLSSAPVTDVEDGKEPTEAAVSQAGGRIDDDVHVPMGETMGDVNADERRQNKRQGKNAAAGGGKRKHGESHTLSVPTASLSLSFS